MTTKTKATKKAVTTNKGGRPKAEDAAKILYRVDLREDLKTPVFYWQYRKDGALTKPTVLLDPDTDKPIAADRRVRADKVAAMLWQQKSGDQVLADHDMPARGKYDPAKLLPLWYAHLTATRAKDNTIKRNKQVMNYLLEYTDFKKCKDMRVCSAEYAEKLCDDMRKKTLPASKRYPNGRDLSVPEDREAVDKYLGMYMQTLRAFAAYCTFKHSCPSHDVALKKLIRGMPVYQTDEDHVYGPEQMEALDNAVVRMMADEAIDPRRYAALVHIRSMFYGGPRVGESLTLKVADLRFHDGGRCEKYFRGEFVIDNSKRERQGRKVKVKRRICPLFEAPASMLRAWITKAGLRPCDALYPAQPGRIEGYAPGKPLEARAGGSRDILKDVCEEAGVPYMGWHIFRHVYICIRVRMADPISGLKVDLQQVKDEVGHSDKSKVTLNVYSKPGYALLPQAYTDINWQKIGQDLRDARAKAAAEVRPLLPAETKGKKALASSPKMLQQVAEVDMRQLQSS